MAGKAYFAKEGWVKDIVDGKIVFSRNFLERKKFEPAEISKYWNVLKFAGIDPTVAANELEEIMDEKKVMNSHEEAAKAALKKALQWCRNVGGVVPVYTLWQGYGKDWKNGIATPAQYKKIQDYVNENCGRELINMSKDPIVNSALQHVGLRVVPNDVNTATSSFQKMIVAFWKDSKENYAERKDACNRLVQTCERAVMQYWKETGRA